MSQSAKLLTFPERCPHSGVTVRQAEELAQEHFASDKEAPSAFDESLVSIPEYLSSACKVLEHRTDISPRAVATLATRLHESIERMSTVGLFDERDYFLGLTALLVSRACRHLGHRDEAERWLDKSEVAFRHTLNPGPSLSSVSYARLALRYEMRQFQDVIDHVPSLTKSFERLGMRLEAAKSQFLLSVALKQAGRRQDAVTVLDGLRTDPAVSHSAPLLGQVLIEAGEHCAADGDFLSAVANFKQAFPLLQAAQRPVALAHLKFALGDTFRKQDDLASALTAFRDARGDFQELGMATYVAYMHVLTAETLMAMSRPREAEWEILAALPTIDSEKMVPEGFAAVALLRESVKQRKLDTVALRDVKAQLAHVE